VWDPASGGHRTILRPLGRQLYRTPEGFMLRVPIARSRSTAVGEAIFVGNGARWQIDVHDFEGTHRASWRRTDVDLRLSEDAFRDLTERLVAEQPDENARRAFRRAYAEQPVPETVPAYDRLLPDAASVWARVYQLPFTSESERWAVFDAGGRLLGELALPDGFELLEIAPDLVLGIQRDELDVESVRGYRLNRRR
jgi:hypothetical protein